jgi:hypothetical protein
LVTLKIVHFNILFKCLQYKQSSKGEGATGAALSPGNAVPCLA